MSEYSERKPTIGIITALPKEYAAVSKVIENTEEVFFPGHGAGQRYLLGEVPTRDEGKQTVVLCLLSSMGNNVAAIRASLLLGHFQEIQSIIMVGIAGGIPYPEKPDDHVRLGDIVISNEKGVIQYDFDKETITENIHRHPPRPPSASLIEGIKLLEADELNGKKPWLEFIVQTLLPEGEKRPSRTTDILVSSTNPDKRIKHPRDPKRRNGEPRIFTAPIASANKLLKNPIKRDQLRDKFGVKAVEMEGSGIADATWNCEVGYLVIRGICDYCDSNKGDKWQAYAAAVAAAYTRALLGVVAQTQKTSSVRSQSPPEWKIAIDKEYQEVNEQPHSYEGAIAWLGNSVEEYKVALPSPKGTTGYYRIYEKGTIYWSPQYGAVAIWYGFRDLHQQQGGSSGWLGFPTKREYSWEGGQRTDFEGGYLFWTPNEGNKIFRKEKNPWEESIEAEYQKLSNRLSNPTSDYEKANISYKGTPGFWRSYKSGIIYWSSRYGAVSLWGNVQRKYNELSDSSGWLGFPIRREYDWFDGRRTDFEGGYIYWDGQQLGAYQYEEYPFEQKTDYSQLSKLLEEKKWEEANWETERVILLIAGREKDGLLSEEDINHFPCSDLCTIDQLWVHHSRGRFGFSVQKRIWEQVAGVYDVHQLYTRLEWLKNGQWLSSSEVTYSFSAPYGHLPFLTADVGVIWQDTWWWRTKQGYLSLLSRVKTCQL